MIFTTSWDDGYALDLRIAELLSRFGATGTFYIAPKIQHGQRMLTEEECKKLGQMHEVGAHTMTHPHLTQVSEEEAQHEIEESKSWVEHRTGSACIMFCYPYGDYDQRTEKIVRETGFIGARTTVPYRFTGNNPYTLPTSLQIYPYPFRPIFSRRILDPLRSAQPYLKRFGIASYTCWSWLTLAKKLFVFADRTHQPWFHLWGHSAEVEKYGLWRSLEDFLKYVATFSHIHHTPNSALVRI